MASTRARASSPIGSGPPSSPFRSWPRGPTRPPSTRAGARPAEDQLLLDRRLVDGHDARQLFAYEVTPAATTHLRGVAAPGDRVVFQRHGTVTPDRICAVRTGRGIVLARVLVQERSLLLLPGEGETRFESVGLPERGKLSDVVVGTHVLLIRR